MNLDVGVFTSYIEDSCVLLESWYCGFESGITKRMALY